jgi:rubrerythrin
MEYHHYCPHIASSFGVLQYTADPNLFLLRDDLTDELGAIIGYLECAVQIRLPKISELFSRIAGEEAGHFIRLIQMLSSLDPVQAEQLKQQELTVLTLCDEQPSTISNTCNKCPQYNDSGHSGRKEPGEQRHHESDFRDMECLGNAIKDELRAINAYQRQVQMTTNQSIQNLLITIMNKEKEHLAKFVKLFYELRH